MPNEHTVNSRLCMSAIRAVNEQLMLPAQPMENQHILSLNGHLKTPTHHHQQPIAIDVDSLYRW